MSLVAWKCPFQAFALGAATASMVIWLSLRRRDRRNMWHSHSAPKKLMDSPYWRELSTAIHVALKAGENINEAVDSVKSVEMKGALDFVTKTDQDNEKLIFDHLKATFPSHEFIGEV
jgi:Inositol monophosphatase family